MHMMPLSQLRGVLARVMESKTRRNDRGVAALTIQRRVHGVGEIDVLHKFLFIPIDR